MKKSTLILFILLYSFFTFGQNARPSLGIIEFKSVGLEFSNEEVTDIFRFEIEKTQKYLLLEKEDMKLKFAKEKIEPENCYDKLCLVFTGKTLLVDKMLSGSISKLGANKLVSLKMYDMKTEELVISKKIEIIHDNETSINEIISESIDEFINGKENFTTIDLRKVEVPEKTTPVATSTPVVTTTQQNSYESFFQEEERKKESRFPKTVIYTRPSTLLEYYPKSTLGIQYSFDDLTAFKFQYAYMFETSRDYVRTIYGTEPGIYSGYEFRGEFIFRIPQDYFDNENVYSRFYLSMEGGFHKKFHKEMTVSSYQNIGYVTYQTQGLKSRVIVGNFKMGVQNVFSNKIYLDPYIGLGVRTLTYSEEIQSNGYDYNYMELRNRTLPNMVIGFDFGVLIK